MENQDRQGRKRTLFRRTREQGDFDSPPLGALGDDQADDGWVDISANPAAQAALDAEQRTATPRKTASMFAPKEKWTETWGDDAWDDEWSDPTARRSSVPPAASPGPDQIDAWLSTDSESWGDVTRETIQKMGADPKVMDAPGATWDNDKAVSSTNTPRPGDRPSDIELAIEKALATVTVDAAPTVLSPVSPLVPPVPAPMLVVDSRLSAPTENPKTRFRRGATNLSPTELPVEPLDTVDLTVKSPASLRLPVDAKPENPKAENLKAESTETERAIDKAIDTALEDALNITPAGEPPTPPVSTPPVSTPPVSSPSVSTISAPPVSTPAVPPVPAVPVRRITEPASPGGSNMVDIALATIDAKQPGTTATRAANWVSDTDATGDLSVATNGHRESHRSELNRTRLHAFVDRISWIGTGVALVAALRLVVLLWAGTRTANPAEGLNLIERIGRGFADAGVVQALLLIVAVALLIVPSLFDGDERSSRIGTGLGIIIGASTLGVIGSLFAYLSDRRLADIAGTATGSFTLRALAALLATAGMSIVAWAAAVRSLRSDG